MDLGALFIGGSLLFIAGVVLTSVVASFDIKRQKAEADRWREAYNSRTEHLEATRIALRDAQANDHRDARGRFAKATTA